MQTSDRISQARLDANRANAQHSTGPVTEEAKARVSQNARTHGLTSRRIQIDDPGQQANYEELRALQLAEHNPQTSSEQHLFEEIVHSLWTIERVRLRQAAMRDPDGLDGLDSEEISLQQQHDRLERYHTRAQNNWIRCRKLLKNLQNERIANQCHSPAPCVEELLEDLKHPTASTQPATNPQEEPTAIERKIMQMDPSDPEFPAKVEKMIRENLAAGFAELFPQPKPRL